MRALAAALWLMTSLALSPEIRFFRYERAVATNAQAAGQACLALDAQTFSHAAPQLADTRLYKAGTEIPYAVRTMDRLVPRAGRIRPTNLGVRQGRTVFDLAMPAGRYSDVDLDLAAQNFLITATVSGKEEEHGTKETELGTFTIFDFTKERLGRSTVLHLPETNLRFLHVSLAGAIRPEDVQGLSIPGAPAREVYLAVVAETSRVLQQGTTSVAEFTVAAHVPVDRVAFLPGEQPANFSRDVSVSIMALKVPHPVTDGSEPPEGPVMRSGNLLRLHRNQDGQTIDEERLALDTFGQVFEGATKWTVSVQNGDDRPLALKAIRLEMTERELCFQHGVDAGAYTLFYGDPALTAPRYDYTTLFEPQQYPEQALAGPETDNPQYQPRPDTRPFSERHPVLLWVSLFAVVLLLASMALRTGFDRKDAA